MHSGLYDGENLPAERNKIDSGLIGWKKSVLPMGPKTHSAETRKITAYNGTMQVIRPLYELLSSIPDVSLFLCFAGQRVNLQF